MKTILAFFFVTFTIGTSHSQLDTAKVTDSLVKSNIQDIITVDQIYMINCAHGHSCCDIGCECCQELHREQLYDRLDRKVTDDVQRTVYGERYRIASSRKVAPIQFKFTKNGEEIGHYYGTELPQFGDSFPRRYSWDYTHLDFSKPYEFVFDSNGEFHLIDRKGEKQKIDFQHKYEITEGVFQVFVVNNGRRIFGLQNADGKNIAGLKYQHIEPVENGQFIVKQYVFSPNSRSIANHVKATGVIGSSGKEILHTSFEEIEYLGNHRYKVREKGNWFLVDDTGQFLSKGYDYLGKYSEDMIAFRKNDKLGFLSSDGEVVIKPKYNWVYEFKNNRAAVYDNDKWGFIDKSGNRVIDNRYDQVRSFDSGFAPIAIGPNSSTDQWGIIDTSGTPIKMPVSIDDMNGFKNGICRFFKNRSGDGMLDSEGRLLLDPHYDILDYGTEQSWFVHGRITVRDYQNDRKMLWINEKGKIIKELPNLDYVRPMFLGDSRLSRDVLPYYLVRKDSKWGIADLEGNIILSMKYTNIRSWTTEYVLLIDDSNTWSYHLKSKSKVRITSGSVREITKDGIVKVEQDGKLVHYNVKGERVEGVNPISEQKTSN